MISNCVFEQNAAAAGGAVWVGGGAPTFVGCTFRDNAAGEGGAIYTATFGRPLFEGCRFAANLAEAGGAVFCQEAFPAFVDCTFQDHLANGGGGACRVEGGGAIFDRCLFSGNEGGTGGVVTAMSSGEVQFLRCTMTGNGSNFGGHIAAFENAEVVVSHSILAFAHSGGAARCFQSSITMQCCDLYGNEGGDWSDCVTHQFDGISNIAADPLFCLPEGGDYTLRSDSPCAQENNPVCGQIGALQVGCVSASLACGDGPSSGLRPVPNPARAGQPVRLLGRSDIAQAVRSLEIHDIAGRLIRTIDVASGAIGEAPMWDGRDSRGRPAAAGLYRMLARTEAGHFTATLVLLR